MSENVIEFLLSRSKRDKNGILVFECEESSDTLFDFGIGNLGIYWSIGLHIVDNAIGQILPLLF